MNKEDLKTKIVAANVAYRDGKPTMTDQAFDDLCDICEALMDENEWNVFRNSLHEVKGKVKHPFIMGSLDKLKYEEPEVVKQFVSQIRNELNVSAKIDGISCRLHYDKNGKLTNASSRGDGSFGEDLTDKIMHVKNIPHTIPDMHIFGDSLDIRGELVILKDDFAKMSSFANARNAAAGIMGRKEWNAEDISNISFIAYTILGKAFTKSSQFKMLDIWGFKTAWNTEIHKPFIGIVDELFEYASQNFEYDVDGLVICDSEYVNEDKYRPDACKAFKINQLVADTKVIDVAFEGPSKNGVFCPVALLEPVELGGATISRCSLYNLDFIESMNIKYGSKVRLMRSGDVIPKIIEVIHDANENMTDIEVPTECPVCGSKLERDGVNMRCMNPDCADKRLHQAVDFIKRLGVKSASEATFKKFGIVDVPSILKFKADKKYKSEVKLENELMTKVFSRSKQELLAAMNFEDLGETLINKIVDFYGYSNIEAGKPYIGLPSGVGELTLQKFKDKILENLGYVNMFINDSRYNYLELTGDKSRINPFAHNGMSVCFTGKLITMSRAEASKKAEAAGYEVKGGVNKGLTYLVTNDTESGSSKNRKAKELGTKVISEKEFLKLIETTQMDLGAL